MSRDYCATRIAAATVCVPLLMQSAPCFARDAPVVTSCSVISVGGEKAFPNRRLGTAILKWDDTLIVSGGPLSAGIVYRYRGDARVGFELIDTLGRPDDPISSFGQSIEVDGDWLFVGDPRFDPGRGIGAGGVFGFVSMDGALVERARVLPPNNDITMRFGESLAIWDGMLAVGAPDDEFGAGSVYLYEWRDGEWCLRHTVRCDECGSSAQFGSVVRVAGEALLVGAPFAHSDGAFSGAITIVERRDLSKTSGRVITCGVRRLRNPAGPGATLGYRFDADADGRIVVTALAEKAIWLYEAYDEEPETILQLKDGSPWILGSGLDIARGSVAVGAMAVLESGEHDRVFMATNVWASGNGSEFVFAELIPPVPAGLFGESVALLDSHTLVAGGSLSSTYGAVAGDVLLFDLHRSGKCCSDVDGDGKVAITDVLSVLAAWRAYGTFADANRDGLVDFDDVLAVISSWGGIDC